MLLLVSLAIIKKQKDNFGKQYMLQILKHFCANHQLNEDKGIKGKYMHDKVERN